MRRVGLTTFALAMLITGSIDSIRNLPTTALFGSSLIFFFLLSAVLFLLPTGLVAAELTSHRHLPGGIYAWVKRAFGPEMGLMAIWLQWVNTLIWYPTILSFIAGTAAYLIDPALAQNKYYLIGVILCVFWSMAFINARGIKASARFASFCAVVGMIIPMALIIGLGISWAMLGKPLEIHFHMNNLLPNLSAGQSWISLTAIMTAFLGMELAAVHVKQVDNAQKRFPKALIISAFLILGTMVLGSLAIAFVIPQGQINLVDGVVQAFQTFLSSYHLSFLLPVFVVMLLLGSLGGMTNWIISPINGALQAGEDGYLPKALCVRNHHGAASRLLMLQAGVVSLICLVFLLMPSVNGSYWLLTALSTQLYMVMYVFMFVAAIRLKKILPSDAGGFQIPGGQWGLFTVCVLGLFGSFLTLVVGFIPPENIAVGGDRHYEMMFTGGMLIMMLPALLHVGYLKWARRKQQTVFISGPAAE